jgi:hypothetical protein
MVIDLTFEFGQDVIIDDGNVTGRIIGAAVYGYNQHVQYQVVWWTNGEQRSEWIYEWRLKHVTRYKELY